jgi:TolB-like protein
VLPFDNLSRDPENAYFSEGIQDEILTRLAKTAELKVISRTSTQRFKSSPDNLPQIAQQLGVENILEGSVQKPGDQVRVNVQLIHAATDTHLWADTYDRKLTDVFAVESEIAKAVADRLKAKLTGTAEHVLASRPTENPEAHQLYMKGRYFWNKRTTENLKKRSITLSKRSGRIQPTRWRIPGSRTFMRFCLTMPPLHQRMMLKKRWLPPAKRWNSMRAWPKHTHPWPTRSC